jgi:hypothetical protein
MGHIGFFAFGLSRYTRQDILRNYSDFFDPSALTPSCLLFLVKIIPLPLYITSSHEGSRKG